MESAIYDMTQNQDERAQCMLFFHNRSDRANEITSVSNAASCTRTNNLCNDGWTKEPLQQLRTETRQRGQMKEGAFVQIAYAWGT